MSSFRQNLVSKGIESSMLDSVVDDAASREASRVNNEGMKEQLEYLEKVGMTESDIMEALELN